MESERNVIHKINISRVRKSNSILNIHLLTLLILDNIHFLISNYIRLFLPHYRYVKIVIDVAAIVCC